MTCGDYCELEFADGMKQQKVIYLDWNDHIQVPQIYTESDMEPESGYYQEHANTSYCSAYRWPGVSFLYLNDSSDEMQDDLWGDPLLVGWG